MNQIETPSSISLIEPAYIYFFPLILSFQHSMVYFFHHYELPVIVQQAQLQQLFMRSVRNNNNGQATAAPTAPGNANQQNRENQQQQAPGNEPPTAAAAPERPVNNANNNMFLIRGTYRRRVNHLVERLRNNFYSNVFGVGMIAADNNNNNAANNPGLNNLTRSLRLLNLLFPNRPILNVRIINVRSASASATVADILRTAEGGVNQVVGEGNATVSQEGSEASQENSQSDQDSESQVEEFPAAVRLETLEESSLSPTPVVTSPRLLNPSPSPDDPSLASNDVNVVPESSMKHRSDGDDVNNSENVMQSSTTSDGGTTTSSCNEQC
jgi:hypothetical protein